MSEPVKIVIVIENGRVSSVASLGVPLSALLIDYDAEGDDLIEIPNVGGEGTSPAQVELIQTAALQPEEIRFLEPYWL